MRDDDDDDDDDADDDSDDSHDDDHDYKQTAATTMTARRITRKCERYRIWPRGLVALHIDAKLSYVNPEPTSKHAVHHWLLVDW